MSSASEGTNSRSWLDRLSAFLLGVDFFISYSQGDARGYATQLASLLRGKGHLCFLDTRSMDPGDKLDATIKRAVRRCSAFVVIASPGALESKWVRKEYNHACAKDRPVVPISIAGLLQTQVEHPFAKELGNHLYIRESSIAFERAAPSMGTLWDLERRQQGTRKLSVMTRGLVLAVAVFAVLAIAASIFGVRSFRMAGELQRQLGHNYTQRGQQELATGRPLRALAYFHEAYRILDEAGAADPVLRFLIAEAQRQPGGSSKVLASHIGPVVWGAFAPDGRRAVTASQDGTAIVWDTASGTQVLRLEGHTHKLSSAMFTPGGERIVTTSADGTARLWDARNGNALQVLRHGSGVLRAAVSPDGQWLLTHGIGAPVLWRPAESEEPLVLEIPGGDGVMVVTADFSPDGRWIVASGYEINQDGGDKPCVTWVWNLRGKRVATFEGRGPVARFSPDSRLLLMLGTEGLAEIHRIEGWGRVAQLGIPSRFMGTVRATFDAWWHPDGQAVLLSNYEGTQLWEVAQQKMRTKFELPSGSLDLATFSRDGRRLLGSSDEGILGIWDTLTGRRLVSYEGHTGPCPSIAFSPDEQQVLSACMDGDARLWSTSRQSLLVQPGGSEEKGMASGISVVAGSSRMAVDGTVPIAGIWDLQTGRRQPVLKQAGASAPRVVKLSPEGRTALLGFQDGPAVLWSLPEDRQLASLGAESQGATAVAFSPKGHRLALVAQGRLQVFDSRSGEREAQQATDEHGIEDLAFSPDGELLLTTSALKEVGRFTFSRRTRLWRREGLVSVAAWDGGSAADGAFFFHGAPLLLLPGVKVSDADGSAVGLFDTRDGTLVRSLAGQGGLPLVASVSPDDTRIALARRDGSVQLWDMSGNLVGTLEGHQSQVQSVAFSPDSALLVTGGLDGTVRLWDARRAEPLGVLEEGARPILQVAFGLEGKRLVTQEFQGSLKLFDVSGEQRPAAELTKALQGSVWSIQDGTLVATPSASRLLGDQPWVKRYLRTPIAVMYTD